MTAQTVAPVPLTDQELTILREFGRGADVAAIADQLGIDRKPVGEIAIDWCNLNRSRARELARSGVRPAPKPAPVKRERRTSKPARGQQMVASAKVPERLTAVPAPPPPAAGAAEDQAAEVARVEQAVSRVLTDQLNPIERWASNRCPTCRYVGPTGEHPTRCDGQPVPVTIVVLPEVA